MLSGPEHYRLAFALTLVSIGLGIGAAWEIVEFTYDHLTGPRSVIQGKFDTVLDLLYDTAGATIAAIWLAAAGRG